MPPWAREHRTGRFHGPPVPGQFRGPGAGAAIGAGLFQALGAKQQAGDGHVLVAMRPALYLLLLVGPVALLFRRRYPVVAFVIAAAASLGFATVAQPHWFWTVAPIIALFQLGACGRRTVAFVCAGVSYAAYLLIFWVFADPIGLRAEVRPGLRETLLLGVALAAAIFLGGIAKIKGEQMAQAVKVRAERERAEEEQQRRQASEERLRIARELHDVIGHHLSLINVQAGVGLHLMDNRPEQAREALTAIKTASSEALREVRSVLGALRTEDEAAPRQPALGLSRLDDLTADAGLPVTTKVTGEVRPLPPEVDRAAYRIVQEALTNVRRHAGPGATALVSVDYLPTALHLAIRNETANAPAPAEGGPPGTGIAGMRARAQSLGGTLEAGPVPDGFLVSVLLPATDDSPSNSPRTASSSGAAASSRTTGFPRADESSDATSSPRTGGSSGATNSSAATSSPRAASSPGAAGDDADRGYRPVEGAVE
ncbi:histidine kinase [Actinoplanes sp. TRM 88003]|uniref:histidine kinase n=1 Tax=Paractinoplanes aksuensis TaxID=2939490 RepID=A0ABT1DW48_9ACTN|nr:histidine kinase [Actinoplanes aksuensis]MCO8275017.1 histidine kinase [Actinoplanes aksuensis]